MRQTRSGPDPLLLLILASTGLVASQGCGGESVGAGDLAPDGAGATSGSGGDGVGATGGTTGGVGGFGGMIPPETEGVLGCANPAFTFTEEAGYVYCDNGGFFHRSSSGSCPQTPLREGEPSSSATCVSDTDCSFLTNGRCYSAGGPFVSPSCVSSCETDADCDAGSACWCGPVANLCVPSTCREDADCGGNLLCASYNVSTGPCQNTFGFTCQTPSDGCTASCPAGYTCRPDTEKDPITRSCVPMEAAGGTCGRPFLVSGTERLARATSRDDWRDGTQQLPELLLLEPVERSALASHWQAAALMEHASIAAFARFALELLALGAPASLLEDTTAAIKDEQRHATTCFALASAFADAPVGPGPLPIGGALAAFDLESVTVTTFLEGCIGETIAAVEARELALTVRDPVIRQALAGIAEDEARHALLAWGYLKWALEQGGADLAARVHDAFRAETERRVEHPPTTAGLSPERALALGLPSAGFRAEVRRRVLGEIVKPCLDALVRFPACYATGACPPAPSFRPPAASW